MPSVRYTLQARRDLIDILLEIAEVNPVAADDLYNRLEARVEILCQFPESGPLRPDIAPEARALVELPYLILYRIVPTAFRSFAFCTARGISTAHYSLKAWSKSLGVRRLFRDERRTSFLNTLKIKTSD